MLKLKEIKKDYVVGDSTINVLKGVDIEFRENEFVSILGPSGCGKTTLLNIIGGLDRYTSGDLKINGKSTKDFKDCDWDSYRNHSIGFVFQSYNLIPHQTVLSNVELALTISGVSKSERRQRAIKALEQVGLGDQLHKKPNQMSGGQMQRVAIARALVNNPEILLADEPTGALDTETSVQIMELLKSISKDKLIIMVTHNPELAEKYSSRIIRLLDGRVTGDTNPYKSEEIEEKKELSKEEKKQLKRERKKLKTSMNFFTALSLSLNNLLTKKARTFLTSFAGSIGIIGIALILSLSNGVQVYIDTVQSDTLSSYPLQINETSTSMGSIMNSMAETKEEDVNHDMDKIYSQNQMSKTINTFLEETKKNNLEKLKKYLDSRDDIKDLTSDVQYTYSTTLNVFKADTSNGAKQINPSSLLTDMGYYSDDQLSAMSSMGMGQADVWSEMIDNEKLIKSQYKVLAGKMPEKYNEVILVVDKNNEINDYVLYSLGILDSSKLNGVMKKFATGEKIDLDDKQRTYTYDELLGLRFKAVASTDFYKKTDSGWEDMREDSSYMKNVVNNGLELKVVGIVKPSEEASSSSISGAIGYRHDLMTYLMKKVDESEIVKEQLANKDVDVFTGFKFAKDGEKKSQSTSKSATAKIQQTQMDKSQTGGMSVSDMTGQNSSADMSNLTEAQKKYMASLTDEQMKLLQEIMKEQAESIKKIQDSETSDSTYDDNLKELGYAVEEKPSSINIYPVDFAAKEKIIDIIDDYNKNASEQDTIEYTDYVGLMMSSVTSIINAISYVLIAFVAISLVVSSIMIGIITYISVLERTKEIGILRAIGASKKDVSRVFNAETVIVGLTAGLLGIGISYLITIPINMVIKSLTDVPVRASIPVVGAVILIAISVVLTLIAGLFPSRIAAKKDPVIALRTE